MRPDQRARLLLCLLLLPWLTGCWNKAEIEEAAYVLAVGIDKGEASPYKITVAIARPDKLVGEKGGGGGGGGGNGGSEEKPMLITSVESPSLTGAIAILNGYIGRKISLHHTRAVFLHEGLAQTEGLPLLDEMLRFRQLRETAFFVVTREQASTFLAAMNPRLDKNALKYIEQLTYHFRRNAMLPASSQLSAVASRLNVKYAQPVTYYAALVDDEEEAMGGGPEGSQSESRFQAGQLPRKGGSNVEMLGAAAFRDERMVGVLTGEETRFLLMLQNQFEEAYVAFKDPRSPGQFVTVQLSRGRPPRITVERTTDRPRIRGLVTLEAEVVAIQSGVDYSEPENQLELERAIASQIREPMRAFIARTQGWESDVVGFGRHLVPRFATVAAWERYDWTSRFPDADIEIDVRVSLRRFGLTLSPTEIRE